MTDPTPQPPARKRAKGRTLGMGETQIADAAKVTQADVNAAVSWWDTHCPPKLRGLLQATVSHDGR